MTHTYAKLEVSAATYDEIVAKLRKAEYLHAFVDFGVIDMHGIALVKDESYTERGHVIVRHDDTGVRSFWTGKGEWAWSIDPYEAIRFVRAQDAKVTLDCIVRPSEGAKLYFVQYPKDSLYVEEHAWTEFSKR